MSSTIWAMVIPRTSGATSAQPRSAVAAPNVRVTYSGGEGEHRADNVLLDTLRFFKSSSPDTAVFLVSNDQALCVAARRLGAADITVLELGAFF